ncbi:SDR family oxidoreductase [Streptomyces sp. NPDC048172]|uniref:SDR family oxidoreductase n=1 Tax=Streptomyces sp. NPDC048172 TaxID=3365505 RepID=UPI0037239191
MTVHRYLVTGATGAQGGAVARLLAARGAEVRGLARGTGPAAAGVTVHAGDLGDAAAVRAAFDGVTHAAVTLPLEYDHATVVRYARHLAAAARAARVRRLVLNTNTPLPERPTGRPGFETRRAAEEVLRGSGVPTVVVRPPVYLDNLFSPWHGPALVRDGVLACPLPAERRVAWMSHADLARVVVAALGREGRELEGRVLCVGGAEVLTGPELASALARGLGRDVRYVPLDVARFEEGLARAVGAGAAAGVAGIYHHVANGQDPGLLAPDPARTARTARALGVRLTPAAEWAGAQPWERWANAPTP